MKEQWLEFGPSTLRQSIKDKEEKQSALPVFGANTDSRVII